MRQLLSIMVVAFGLCSQVFADPLPGQGLDGLRAKAEHGDKWAVKWLGKAAEQGNAIAQLALGTMYELGHGVPRDNVTAYMWFSLSAAQDPEMDRKHLDFVEAKLTAGQLAEAQRTAHDWRPAPPRCGDMPLTCFALVKEKDFTPA